jgi:DNA-directed RNA polymerase subunit L
MLVEIEEDDHRAIELKIKEEDISVMYIIQHEILKDKNTEFAGVVLKHALIRDYVMRIISKSGSSMSILHKSFESAMNSLEIIQGMLSEEFKKEEVSASS